MTVFKDIRAGDRVKYRARVGMTVNSDGKAVQEYQVKTGTANGLLLFPQHVVLDTGGKHGRPQVVDAANYVSHTSKGRGFKR